MTDKEIEDIAQRLLPQGKAYAWNQALMDYAGAVLKKERIPIPKQSKFIGSHRYYRGQVVKVLLEKKQVAMDEIGVLIKKEYKDTEYEWLKELLDALVKEGFITSKILYVYLHELVHFFLFKILICSLCNRGFFSGRF